MRTIFCFALLLGSAEALRDLPRAHTALHLLAFAPTRPPRAPTGAITSSRSVLYRLKGRNAAGVKASASSRTDSAIQPWLAAGAPVLGLSCVIATVCALDRVVMSVAILPMAEQYGFSDSTRGLIASAFSAGYFLGLVPAGYASSSLSPKWILGSGILLWSVAQAATPMAAESGLAPLLAARVLMGIGEAAAIPSLQVIAANFVPASSRSRYWGVLTSFLSLGTIGAYSVSPTLIREYGWPSAFQIYGIAGILLAAVWSAVGASEPEDVSDCVPTECDVRPGSNEPEVQLLLDGGTDAAEAVPWRSMIRSRPVWALAAAHSASNFFLYFSLSWLPTFFSYQYGLSTEAASAASQAPFIAAAVTGVTSGVVCDSILVDRFGMSLTEARKLMQGIACAGPALVVLALAQLDAASLTGSSTLPQAEVLFVAGLSCQACSAAGFGCAAQDISRRYASLLYGATSAVSVLVGAAGQYLTGALLEASNRDFSGIFTLTAAVEVAGLCAWLAWWSSERVFE